MPRDTEHPPYYSVFDRFPWITPDDFQEASGLDARWFGLCGDMYDSDPFSNSEASKLTYQQFCDLFRRDIQWLFEKYKLTSLTQVAIIDVTKIYATVYERGVPMEDQNPDLPPQQGTSLTQLQLTVLGTNLQEGMSQLAGILEQDNQRFHDLYPFIIATIESELLRYPEKPKVIFIPEFLRDSSPFVKKMPQIAKDIGVETLVFMRESHGAYEGFVDMGVDRVKE